MYLYREIAREKHRRLLADAEAARLAKEARRTSGGSEMPTPTTAHRLELAHRESNGIEITLFWSEPAQGLTVEIFDVRLEERLTFAVDAADALDAFYHPYAYAA